MGKNDGGLAFPVVVHRADSGAHVAETGMSLRAYIATAALQGLLAGRQAKDIHGHKWDAYSQDAPQWAAISTVFADALIAELAK